MVPTEKTPQRRAFASGRALGVLASLLCLSLLPGPARAGEVERLARTLVQMRTEVERLTDALEEAKRARSAAQRAAESQRLQVEAELLRERLRVRTLREALQRKQAELTAAQADDAALRPTFGAGLASLRAYVDDALPFQREARLKALADLEAKVGEGLLTPRAALTRLWAFAEDELRLTRETGRFRQTLEIDGQARLVDVVRLGMVGLYYQSGGGAAGEAGLVRRAGDGWAVVPAASPEDAAAIAGLFDAFAKQIRTGHFTLPSALPAAPGETGGPR